MLLQMQLGHCTILTYLHLAPWHRMYVLNTIYVFNTLSGYYLR